MAEAVSLFAGILAGLCFFLGRPWWGGALLCFSLSFWLGGLGLAGLLPGVVGAAGVLLAGRLFQGKESLMPVKDGERGVVVVDILPHSDRGAVKCKGRLLIAHAGQPISQGSRVILERVEGQHAWVRPA